MAGLFPALPASQAYVRLGTTRHRPAQQVAVSRAETILVVGVPQSIKTAYVSDVLMDAPGVVLATSSRADQWRHTAAVREQMGEVRVLDADGYGPGSTFAWSPVRGCADPDEAIRRAGAFMHAAPRDQSGKDAWHEDRGATLLGLALHGVDLSGGNILDVQAWVQDPEDELFAKALRGPRAAPGWAGMLDSMLNQGPEFLASAVASAESALGWMKSPSLLAVACPRPGEGLDIARFLRAPRPGTIYLIGSERPYGSLTPFFSAFVSEFLEQARVLAEASGGRLPVPLTIAADEAATTARIDFKRWCAVTAGYGITVVAGLQALSQLSAFGGPEDQETIMTLFSTKIFAGGMTNPAELERVSVVCGERESWHREHGSKVRRQERLFPAERIRLLAEFNALVIHRNCKVVQVVIRPVWHHPAYRQVTVVPAAVSTEE
jgi:type IV secretion system protein VirD4